MPRIGLRALALILAPLFLAPLPLAAQQPDLAPYAAGLPACFYGAGDTAGMRACIGQANTACQEGEEGGMSTVGMSFCMLAERDAWDALLNAEYKAARDFAKAADQQSAEFFPEFAVRADQVRDAQRAWIAFRDANCAMQYGLWGEGSMRQIAGADCQLRMTAERTIDLRNYYQGMQ